MGLEQFPTSFLITYGNSVTSHGHVQVIKDLLVRPGKFSATFGGLGLNTILSTFYGMLDGRVWRYHRLWVPWDSGTASLGDIDRLEFVDFSEFRVIARMPISFSETIVSWTAWRSLLAFPEGHVTSARPNTRLGEWYR